MPLLAYCITEADPGIELPAGGVRGAVIESFSAEAVCCFASEYEADAGADDKSFRESALEFNRVLQGIFYQTAILPFRFPTLLADKSGIDALLREQGNDYAKALARLKNKVQVDIRVSVVLEKRADAARPRSGTDFLREQQSKYRNVQTALDEIRASGGQWIEGWRERTANNGARCFALISRTSAIPFLGEIRTMRPPPGIIVRVTGPWPPAEFVQEP